MSNENEQPEVTDATPASTEPVAAEAGNVEAVSSPSTTEASGDTSSSEPSADTLTHPAESVLARIEEIAIFWGGEVGTELRNLIGKVRGLL